ncbi:putative UDP-rhamnose:rhamnosyltransferase 1 [Spatholobus suberectus]|nr:putative UDP-rhamnose:rhamnosyltransferase 1 [Spatholobus suberectus]
MALYGGHKNRGELRIHESLDELRIDFALCFASQPRNPEALAKAGVRVSFISTPKNIQRLPKLPSTLDHLVDFVQLPLPSLDKELLPEGAEATMDIPLEKIQYLKLAYDQLQHAVKQFVANQVPDWIICDFSPHLMADISQEFQLKLIFYSVLSAPAITFLGPPGTRKAPFSPESLTVPPEWVTFRSLVAYQRHEAIAFCAGANKVNASGVSDLERRAMVFGASKVVLVRSCYEIEGEYLKAFQKLVGKPVIPIGLLPVERTERERGIVDGCSGNIFEWLDKQPSKSVVFVGFGSELKLSRDQVFEIAYGLEESELPFLWALRKPIFHLSIALAKAGVRVSFITTPKNIQRLPKLPSTLSHLVDLVQLPLPSLDKELLPEGAEATIDIPFEKIQYLKLAYDQLQHAVKQFDQLQKAPISPESLTVPPEWVTFPSSVAFQRHEAIAFCAGLNEVNASGVCDLERIATVCNASKAVIFCSCYEIEGEYLNVYQKLVGKPVIPIGLLPVERPARERGIVDGCSGNIFEWLDRQASKSVVFVGFGSECKLSKDQVFEIADGLEDSELPFLWALRKPKQ